MTIILPQNILIDYLKQTPINSAHPFETFETLLDNLLNHYISPKDKLLLELAFKKDLTQAELDDFLANWDIEKHGSDTALILAHIMKNHPHLQFNSYTAPRLTGVKNYYRFQNLRLLAQYQNIVKILNKHNIFPLIIKGGAMKHLRPDLPRIMNDIDILLETKQEYHQSLKIIKTLGYTPIKSEHSADIKNKKGESILDLHWCLDVTIKNPLNLNQDFFSRATKQNIFNTTSYLPKTEDTAFIILFNLAKNLKQASNISSLIYTLFDIAYLIKTPSFNWQIVAQNIKQTQTAIPILAAIRFLNKLCPMLIPEDLLDKTTLHEELYKQLRHDIFYAHYVFDVKYACKKLKFSKSIKNWSSLKIYLKNKSIHFITKRFIKSDLLLKLFFKLKGVY